MPQFAGGRGWWQLCEGLGSCGGGQQVDHRDIVGSIERRAVRLSRPDKSGLARISGHLGKIARVTPGFLLFCPDFCDLVRV